MEKNNLLSIIWKILGITVFLICLIVGTIISLKLQNVYYLLISMIGSSFYIIVAFTIAEIIQLLHDIRNNTRK